MDVSPSDGRPRTAPGGVSLGVPVRRSVWVSFWVAAAAVAVAFLSAAAFVSLPAFTLFWLRVEIDGFWLVFLFGLFWGGLFFLSRPLRRRLARSLDGRRPGISLSGGTLSVPVSPDSTLHFKLQEPHELTFGWCEHVMTGAGGPTTNTRAVWTHATLTQAGRRLSFIAEDSVREALAAGWKRAGNSERANHQVSMWAGDLVALVEAIRATRAAGDGG